MADNSNTWFKFFNIKVYCRTYFIYLFRFFIRLKKLELKNLLISSSKKCNLTWRINLSWFLMKLLQLQKIKTLSQKKTYSKKIPCNLINNPFMVIQFMFQEHYKNFSDFRNCPFYFTESKMALLNPLYVLKSISHLLPVLNPNTRHLTNFQLSSQLNIWRPCIFANLKTTFDGSV